MATTPKVIIDLVTEIKTRISAREQEIALLKKSLQELIAQRDAEKAKLQELKESFADLETGDSIS